MLKSVLYVRKISCTKMASLIKTLFYEKKNNNFLASWITTKKTGKSTALLLFSFHYYLEPRNFPILTKL